MSGSDPGANPEENIIASGEGWVVVSPVPDAFVAPVARHLAMKRKSLEKIIGLPEARVPLIGRTLRADRIAAAFLNGEVVGHLSYRMDGAGAVCPDWAAYRARFGLIGAVARWVATDLTLRRGRAQDLYIESFAVDRITRGKGIGGALLAWLSAEVIRRGKEGWRTELPEANLPAKRAYEKLGARQIRTVWFGPVARLLHTKRALVYRWVPPEGRGRV